MASATNRSGFNTTAVAAGAITVMVLVWVLALFLEGGFLALRNREYEQKVLAPTDESVREYHAAQQEILDGDYRWIDKEQGTVGVPIERAIDLVVERDGLR